MTTERTQEELMNAFIKQCKKVTSNFTTADIISFHYKLVSMVLLEDGNLDINKYKNDPYFIDNLFAMSVAADFMNMDNIRTELERRTVVDKQPKVSTDLPNGWRVIK